MYCVSFKCAPVIRFIKKTLNIPSAVCTLRHENVSDFFSLNKVQFTQMSPLDPLSRYFHKILVIVTFKKHENRQIISHSFINVLKPV